jgi:hypothetical protein
VILRSKVRDCLFLNWALPESVLPRPPASLRYQSHDHDGETWVFASALLFRHEGLHLASSPRGRLSYPQLNLRFYTLDEDEVPSVLFHRMWVPAWVVPVARWVGRQIAEPGRLRFPQHPAESEAASRWQVRAGGELDLTTRRGAPLLGVGPRLGGWEETVRYFRQRPRGYGRGPSGLRRVETSHVSVAIVPVEVEIGRTDLLSRTLSLGDDWPALHSAWLCPQLTFDFEVLPEAEAALGRRLPAPG